jgi:hypothetical protein
LPTDGSAPTRLGPLVCRKSFHNMYIPPVGEASETPKDGRMGFSAAQVAPKEVAAGELTKNVSLGVVISLCLFGGLGLLCGGPGCASLTALAWPAPRAQPGAKVAGARSGRQEGDVEAADGASSPAQACNPPGCFSALPGLLSKLRGLEPPCSPAGGSLGGRSPQTPPRAGSHGAHGRSPRGLASGTAVAWPPSWLEQLQRVVTRSLSPVRVAAARYFPASMVSPRSSPAGTAFDFGMSSQRPAAGAQQAAAGADPASPLETARRQLQFPAEFSSPGGPSALEEARGSHRPPLSSRGSSRRRSRDESAQPQWPQAWSPSRESAWSGGISSRGPSRSAPDAGAADAVLSRDVGDAEGLSSAASRLQSRLPPSLASPPVSSRSSAPYTGPAPKR